MLSLRSLAFILCSAIRRARSLSCAALHCFPDIINGRTMATNNATKMATAAPMLCSLIRTVYTFKAITARGAKDPLWNAGWLALHDNAQDAVDASDSLCRGL